MSKDNQDEYDPPSSLLTPSQRAYLRGDREDVSDGNKRAIRRRIRNRLKAGIMDCHMIVNQLPLDDIETGLQEPEVSDGEVYKPVGSAVSSLAALVYLKARSYEADPAQSIEVDIRHGIADALGRLGVSTQTIDVTIDIETGPDLADLADEDLAELSRDTLLQLLNAGEISQEDFAEVVLARKED